MSSRIASGSRTAALAFAVVVLLLAPGCLHDSPAPPVALVDGTAARRVPVELEAVDGPAVLTKAAVRPGHAGGRTSSCLEYVGRRGGGASVERTGALAETVTVLDEVGRALVGCDGGGRGGRRWCGTAFGVLHRGRLRDPRLDVLCRAGEGEPLGLAWIEPLARASFVAVRQAGFVEVYAPAGGLPVRIATTDVDSERSTATFHVSEHTASGRLLRRYEVETAVAG